ncbi:MAG: hypothetical protein WBY44_16435 [Bryobacteraceae bacterium]
MDAFTALLIAACAAVPVFALGLLLHRSWQAGNRLRTIVIGLTFIHETSLVALPAWYSCFTGFEIEAGIGVTPDQLLRVYAGEALFVLLFAAVLLLPGRRQRAVRAQTYEKDNALVCALVVGAALLYVGRLFSPVFSAQDVAHHYQIVVQTNFWDELLEWGITLVQWPGFVAAAIVAADRSLSRPMRWIAFSVLASELVFSMLHGLRGGMVWVVSMVAIGGYYIGRKRLLLAAGALTLFLVPLFPWLHSTMRYASIGAPLGTSRIEMIPFLLRGITDPDTIATGADAVGFLESWAVRAEGGRNSTALYALYDRGEAASYMPILGAAVLPIPRMWWSAKPVAGSTDTTNLGAAIYRVQQGKPNSAFYDMGPILASAHAYWEGGWIWLAAAPLLSGWMWRLLFVWADRARRQSVDIIVLTFTTALPIDGFFGGINPVFAYVRILWITLLPLGLAVLVIRKYMQARRAAVYA